MPEYMNVATVTVMGRTISITTIITGVWEAMKNFMKSGWPGTGVGRIAPPMVICQPNW